MEKRGGQLTRRDLLMMEADPSKTYLLPEPGSRVDAEAYFQAISIRDDRQLGEAFSSADRVSIDLSGIRVDR